MSSSDANLSADALDHIIGPPAPTAAERRGLTLALLSAAVLHLLIPLALFLWYAFGPKPAPPVQEIPVEVVVEPPPPKQEKPEAKPPPPPDDEKPAYDAPSAASQEKANRESPDTKTQGPSAKAEPSPTPGAPEKSETPPAAPEQKAEAAPTPDEAKPSPDAEQPAAPSPSPAEADATPPAPEIAPKPAPPPAPSVKAPVGAPLPPDDVLPQYKVAHAATESPVIGGNADTRYFTIVYGMIRSHLREPPHAAPPVKGGAVVFMVDEGGNLVERKIVSSSGSPSLDMAVMAAIAEAAPYPAPPGWQPRAMRLTYGR
jgi:periplasmic protein TonB